MNDALPVAFSGTIMLLCMCFTLVWFCKYVDTRRRLYQLQRLRLEYCWEYRLRQVGMETEDRVLARVSGEFHDHVAQTFAGARAMLVTGLYTKSRERLTREVVEYSAMLQECTDRVRRMSHTADPHIVERLGLHAALKALLELERKKAATRWQLDYPSPEPELKPAQGILLYRVVQESAHNILKHAGASSAWVSGTVRDGIFMLQIGDNGVGLPVGGSFPSEGMGLDRIRRRVSKLGGTVDIRTAHMKGFIISVSLTI